MIVSIRLTAAVLVSIRLTAAVLLNMVDNVPERTLSLIFWMQN